MPHPRQMVDDPVKRRPHVVSEAIERALAEKQAARAAMPTRTSLQMIEAIQEELNRQLDPLLTSSKLRELVDDELDRMIRISSATISIHRQLTAPVDDDPSKMSTADLRKAAGKGRR